MAAGARMTWLTWFLFESFPALAAALFTADFILLVIWRRSARAKPLLIGLGLSVVLLTVQGLVVTRREHAARLLRTIERDLVAAKTTGLAAALANDFRSGQMDKEQFLALVARQCERVRISTLHRSQLEIRQSQPERFVAEAAYLADLRSDLVNGWIRSRWELTFADAPDGWCIVSIRAMYIDGIDNPDRLSLELP
jgi:hypothetical protein